MHQTIASCFYVSKKNVLRHNKEDYLELRKFLYESTDQGGLQGYLIERFWNYLFTGKSYNTLTHCYKQLLMNNGYIVGVYTKNILYIKNYKKNPKIFQNINSFLLLKKKRKIIQFPHISIKGEIIDKIQCKDIYNAKQLFKNYLNK